MASVRHVSSLVVVVVLVGLWALVLVPAFRSRQERVDALRSVDRFSSALRVLSRRGTGTTDRRWVVMPSRPDEAPARPRRTAPQQVSAVERRRRTLGALVALVLVTLLLTVVAGATWLLVQLPADAALAAVVVWCGRSAARERERRARAARRERRAAADRAALAAAESPAWSPALLPAPPVPVTTIPLEGTAPAAGVAPVPAPAPQVARPQVTRPRIAPDRAVAARAEAVRVAVTGRLVTADDDADSDVEEPFVREPASGVRLLDLTTPGAWTRRRVLDEPDADSRDAAALTGDDAGLDVILDRRTSRSAASGW